MTAKTKGPLHISPDLSLPKDTTTQTIVVYGGKGMGKTNFGAVLAEELKAAHQRFAWIDPVGVAWGLQYAADGKRPGVEVLILGGVHGDIPIEPTGGAIAADLVADEEVDVVIDISRRPNGSMWSAGEKIRFVTDYCLRLFERQGERRRPLMQIIDEAGRYVPQSLPSGAIDLAKCVGAIEQLVELGRNVGVGVCLITQRSARMNKSVSELAECMIAFRTVGPLSINAILDWFGEHVEKTRWKTLLEQLRSLPRGHALVVSPGWLEFEGVVRVRKRETFDSSATPTAAERQRTSGEAAKPDLAKYQQRMAATIEKAKAEDPRELRKRIAALEAELKKAAAAAPAAKTKTVEIQAVKATTVKALERAVDRCDAALARANNVVARLHEETELISNRTGEIGATRDALVAELKALRIGRAGESVNAAGGGGWRPPVQSTESRARVPSTSSPAPARSPRPSSGPGSEATLDKCQRAILTVLAQHPDGCAKGQLALLSGYRWSGGFRNALSALRVQGLIDGSNTGVMRITDAGLAAGPYEPMPTGTERIAYWLSHPSFGACERRVLGALVEAFPKGVMAAPLAQSTGYEWSGGFRNALSNLRTAGVLVGRNTEAMRAAEGLFS